LRIGENAPIPDDRTASSTLGFVPTLVAVLAAGRGIRFTGPGHKLTATLGDRPVVVHAVRSAVASGIGAVIVVTGPEPAVASAVHAAGLDVTFHPNVRADEGQATSLQVAVEAARHTGADRLVVGLGDQPFVTPEAWRAVAATDGAIVMASYGNRTGHPVSLRKDVWELLPTTGDEGARTVTRIRPDLVVAVPCAGSIADIDTTEDLATWQSSWSTSSPSTGRSTKRGL